MKLETSFNNFLKNIVNLNETRYQTAKSGIETITNILKNDEVFGDKFIDTKPQGSFRQETIIKPVSSDIDFDVDVLFEMDQVNNWGPSDYLNNLTTQLRKFERYKDKVDTRGKNRCVTIDYESDFHIDIIPAIKVDSGVFIMNKTTNQYEPTDGDRYAQWFYNQNAITGKKYLTKTVRLLKYIRDVKGEFDVKSILLTTLLGNQVLATDNLDEYYSDLPTAFVCLLSRLDDYLQANSSVPLVINPVLSSENFNRHLDQVKYLKFRDVIHKYSQQAIDAYDESDEEESLKKWQKIFGNKFTLLEKSISCDQLKTVFGKRDLGEQFLSDFGISEKITNIVKIDANVIQDGFRPFFLRSAKQLLRKKRKLKFIINQCNVSLPYSIKWKIKNTGDEAKKLDALRGEIVDDLGYQSRNESTLYEGSHYVECYIIKNGVCVAKDKIDVPIGNI